MFHCLNSLLVARRTDKRNDTFGSRLREVPILATTATYTCARAVIYLPRGNALRRGGSKTRRAFLKSPENFSGPKSFRGFFSGVVLGFGKAFLKAPDFLPRFSGMFSGNITQGIARASIF